jgi:hypothetical protein
VREECRRALESEHPNHIASIEELGRFGRADAESLSEQGMAAAIASLGPLLALRGIETRRLPTYDVYLSIDGGAWLIVDDEIAAYDPDGMREELEECVMRVGDRRFSLMHETGNSWLPSSRALSAVLRYLLGRVGHVDSSFSLWPGENDHIVFLGTRAMVTALARAGVKPLELWSELDDEPEMHGFRLSRESPFGESDFRDVQRLQRVDEDLSAAIELATNEGYSNPYSTRKVLIARPGAEVEVVDAGNREAALALVLAHHNVGRTIAQAASAR